MDESHLRLLQDMPVFGGLQRETLEFVAARAPVVEVAKGDYFFQENEDGNTMYVLESGEVSILKSWEEREYVLRYLHAGDCFGEIALLDLFPRSASVLATTNCRALELSAGLLYDLCRSYQEQCTLIYMNVARELARRARAADQRMFLERVERSIAHGEWIFHAH